MHAHAHAHGPGPHDDHVHAAGDPRRALLLALVLNAGFLIVEVAAAWWTSSLAIGSDAAHMAGDVSALLLSLGAAQLARRAPTDGAPWGLRRAEVLGGFVNGLALLGIAGFIVVEAVTRLRHSAPHVDALPVGLIGGLGLAVNLAAAWTLWRTSDGNLNVRGALWHMLADALGSLGALIAALFLAAGVQAADAVVSVVLAALVASGAARLCMDAARVLLQLPPQNLDVAAVRAALQALQGVAGVHALAAWSVDGREPVIDVHLVLARDADPHGVCADARAILHDRFDVHRGTVQVEPGTAPCPHASAS